MAQYIAWRAPKCSNVYGSWFVPCARHSVRMTYRPTSAALRLHGSLRRSHSKFLRANKWILILILNMQTLNLFAWNVCSGVTRKHIEEVQQDSAMTYSYTKITLVCYYHQKAHSIPYHMVNTWSSVVNPSIKVILSIYFFIY